MENHKRLFIDNGGECVETDPMSNSGQLETSRSWDEVVPERVERHTTQSGFIRDAIIGIANATSVPFAVTVGLTSWVQFLPDMI